MIDQEGSGDCSSKIQKLEADHCSGIVYQDQSH